MIIKKLIEILNASVIAEGENIDDEIAGAYAGDFLSNVIGKAPAGGVWFTVMNNVNVAAVALLADVRAVAVCEGTKCDPALRERCKREKIWLLETEYDIFNAVREYCRYGD